MVELLHFHLMLPAVVVGEINNVPLLIFALAVRGAVLLNVAVIRPSATATWET